MKCLNLAISTTLLTLASFVNGFVVPSPQLRTMACARSAFNVVQTLDLRFGTTSASTLGVSITPEREETVEVKEESAGSKVRKLASYLSINQGNRRNIRQNRFVILAGLLLAFNSGYINGCCLSGVLKSCGTGTPVAAFTGAYTQAGLAIGAGNFAGFLANIRMIGSYMTGAAISGFINPKPVPGKLSPQLGPAFISGSILMTLSSLLALTRPESRAFLYFAAMANGLQNAVTSAYSANLIRTSHMTGSTSDMGMIFGQMLGGNFENLWRFTVLIILGSSFLTGGITSVFAVNKFKSLALAFNAALYGLISMGIIGFISFQQRISIVRVASGRWKWKNEAPTARYISNLFQKYDKDENDSLDEDNFAALLKEAGIKSTEIGLRAAFKAVDHDGSGSITKDDLVSLMVCAGDDECMLVFDDENER